MAITYRNTKGSPLTFAELDANFSDLDTLKAPKASPTFTGTVTTSAFTVTQAAAATPVLINNTGTGGRNWSLKAFDSSGSGSLVLADETAGAQRILLSSTGNVTINAPSSGNHTVSGSIQFNSPASNPLNINAAAGSWSGLNLLQNNVSKWLLMTDNAGSDVFSVYASTTARDVLRCTQNGNWTVPAPVSGTALTVSGGGFAVTGNSTLTGTLGGITGLTVASGGASITGVSSVVGRLTVGASAQWQFDDSGRLINPGNSQPTILANSSAARTTNGQYASFTETVDYGGNFNASTGVFTAPVAGTYMFTVEISGDVTSGTGTITATVRLNSVATIATMVMNINATNNTQHSFCGMRDLSASDTLDFQVAGTGTGWSSQCTRVSIRLLG